MLVTQVAICINNNIALKLKKLYTETSFQMMIELLSKLIDVVNDDRFNQTIPSNFQNQGVHFYCKDKKGKYLNCGAEMAYGAGLNKIEDLIGLTDFDFIWSEDATDFRENDQKVISKEISAIFLENSAIFNGADYTKTQLLSYKKPLYACSKKIIGIMGISIASDIYEASKKCRASNQWMNHFKISQREKDCLYHLVYGRTAKQTAKKLSISHRTVEEHLTSARRKLKCSNRSQLIEKIISLGIL